MVEISWKDAFGCASFASTIATIAIKLLQAVYNDLFGTFGPNDSIVWLYAFGGLAITLVMAIIAAITFVDTGSKLRASWVALGVGLILLFVFIIWAILYDAFYTTAFVHYQPFDWFFGLVYEIAYFAQGQFGDIVGFWNWVTFFYWALFPVFLKWSGVQKKQKYLKKRVAENGW